ncbi:MAG: NUDIX domain-containing protein, partial [Anaerolineae bacterium]
MHILGTAAIIVDDGRVLLTRRHDAPLWVVPGGHLEKGESVPCGCLREVKEETGLEVEIERLVGLYARKRSLGSATGPMNFVFTCRVTGGALQLSDETTAIRYWPFQALPGNVPRWQRQYLADALAGQQAARWRTLPTSWLHVAAQLVYGLRHWQNRLRGRPTFAATYWKLGVFVTLFDGEGRVLLVRRRDYRVWNLPGGKVERHETPWEAALRETREETGLEIELERLTGVYSKPAQDEVVLGFQGRVIGGALTPTQEGAESRYFAVDALPEPILPKHIEHIYDSAACRGGVALRVQDTPPGLEV